MDAAPSVMQLLLPSLSAPSCEAAAGKETNKSSKKNLKGGKLDEEARYLARGVDGIRRARVGAINGRDALWRD